MSEITYDDKVDLQVATNIANINKVTASDMNEIKSVVNGNADDVGDITSLTTTDKTSIVNAVNELNAPEKWVSVGTEEPTDGRRVFFANSKNLFDKSKVTEGHYISSTGSVGNGTNDMYSDYISIIPNTDYYLSGRSGWNNICLYDSNKNFLERITTQGINGVLNITNSSCKYIIINAVIENKNTMQLEQGSAATTYEPYIEKSIKVDNEDFISMDNLVSVGVNQPGDGKRVWFAKSKNLFDNSQIEAIYPYQATTSTTNQVVTITSNSTTGVSFAHIVPAMTLKPNTKYSISFNFENDFLRASIYDVTSQQFTSLDVVITSGRASANFTTGSNSRYRLVIYVVLNKSCKISKVQFEEGSTATTYEPYIEPSINVDGEELNFDNYSTNEQVIGKWIDGKPLYRRVFEIANPSSSNADYIDLSSIGIYRLVHLYGYYKRDTGTFGIPFYDSDTNYSVMFLSAANKLRGRFANANGITDVQVVIEYTKTTG